MPAPDLSVIIANVNGMPAIGECVQALASQNGKIVAEVIVADATGDERLQVLRQKHPWLKAFEFQTRPSIPELRAAGLAESSGEIVVVIEDHCIPADHWYERIIAAHQTHPECVAVGGAIENGSRERTIDWAVFFCEYCDFMPPLQGGIVEHIPGNNVSYKRSAFEGVDDLEAKLNDGFWETTLHPWLGARGDQFLIDPAIAVRHKKNFGFLYYLSQRFHYSRYFAAQLFGEQSAMVRGLRSVGSVVLPPLLLYRIASCVMRKKRHVKELLLAMPYLLVFTSVWAVGEIVGHLLGPGQSLHKIE